MKNNDEVVLRPCINVTGGTIRLGIDNIQIKTSFSLKSPKDVYDELGGPDKYQSLYSRKKIIIRRRG